eukprot:TRINITY_DN4106_c0_g2_i5.p2 TRINITY_DN4106_c0_g2~~TRINITY_DN4106_c0_g2_i5.p2  ORF type:complete len:258 (+),score=147.59 TRINITY_DN4106_c0_g2_i5:69-842(+)
MALPHHSERKHGKTLIMFDVDGTLTVPRKPATDDMIATLAELRKDYAIALVGGSDLKKQYEQMGPDVLKMFDFVFAENGLHAFEYEKEIFRQNFVKHLGEEKLRKFTKTVMQMIVDLDIPVQRGTFFELRNGMVNISPIGRNCSQEERDDFEKYDEEHNVRKPMVAELEKEFGAGTEYNLKFSIGGQISFDAFPQGWDKTYSLRFVEDKFDKIHFFGDKTYEGGNDFEIYTDSRTEGHSVKTFQDTIDYLTANLIGK